MVHLPPSWNGTPHVSNFGASAIWGTTESNGALLSLGTWERPARFSPSRICFTKGRGEVEGRELSSLLSCVPKTRRPDYKGSAQCGSSQQVSSLEKHERELTKESPAPQRLNHTLTTQGSWAS